MEEYNCMGSYFGICLNVNPVFSIDVLNVDELRLIKCHWAGGIKAHIVIADSNTCDVSFCRSLMFTPS